MASTSNFSWIKPVDGGSGGTWGSILNTLFDDADSDLNSVKTTADAALPKAGGAMSGELEIKTECHAGNDLSNISGATTINLSTANFHFGTVTGDATFSFSNWPSSGKAKFVSLELTNGGSQAITWPGAVVWDGDSAPTLQSSGVDVIVFYSRDGGSTIRGMHSFSANN